MREKNGPIEEMIRIVREVNQTIFLRVLYYRILYFKAITILGNTSAYQLQI